MPFSNIPTDSLYKFCALLGLSLIVFNTYYNYEMLTQARSQKIILEGEIQKFVYDQDLHKEKGEKINEELSEGIEEMRALRKNLQLQINTLLEENSPEENMDSINTEVAIGKTLVAKRDMEIKTLLGEVAEENRLLNLRGIDIATKSNLLYNEEEKLKRYSWFLISGVIVGILLSIYGFYNWRRIELLKDSKRESR